jgi:hypothetical protein
MSVLFLSDHPKFSFPRHYTRGYAFTGVGLSLLSSTPTLISVALLGGSFHADFVIRPHFYAPSTNQYTLDFVFDFDASQIYFGSTPVAFGTFCDWGYVVGDNMPRIVVRPTGEGSDIILVDLPAAPTVWRPLP